MSNHHFSDSTISAYNGENESKEFGKTDSMMSTDSGTNEEPEDIGLFRDIIKAENDLAGFSIVWFAGFVIVVILRFVEHEDVKDAGWQWIFCIPIAICSLTWIFSYVITTYRKDKTIESMKIPAFILPFIFKIAIATFFFGRLFYSSGGITDRYKDEANYNGWCDCTMFVVWLSLILSVITTEIIITTVMVNSSQNLRPKIPKKVDFFLFLTRPTLWVYNRLIVMFLTFYCFYWVFGIGPLCTSQCNVTEVAQVSSIGISIFTLPFHNILYLFNWASFDLNEYDHSKQVIFAVIQQVLVFTTILDLLMDIWSISQIFKRIEVEDFTNFGKQIGSTMRGFRKGGNQTVPRNSHPMPPMPPINENEEEKVEEDMVSDCDMDDEIEQLNNIAVGINNNNDNNDDKEEDEIKQEVDNEVMSPSIHGATDTVDDILAHYDMNNLSETEDPESPEAEVDPDDTPNYQKVSSESVQSKIDKNIKNIKYTKIAKPRLSAINSGDT